MQSNFEVFSTLLIPVLGHKVYTPYIINPCEGSWSLYSILLIPVRGRGVYIPYY